MDTDTARQQPCCLGKGLSLRNTYACRRGTHNWKECPPGTVLQLLFEKTAPLVPPVHLLNGVGWKARMALLQHL